MRITVKQAARQLGVSEQYVRLGLQRGELPIGSCVRMSSVYTYHITQERLDEYLGIKNAALRQQDGKTVDKRQQKGRDYHTTERNSVQADS